MRFRHPLLALLLAVSALGATAPPVTAESERAVEDTLLIGLPEGSPPIARRIANEHGARLVEEVEGTGIFVVSTETRWLAALRRSLAADPRVAFVETNHERRASAVPDDLFYPSAQAAYLETIRLPEAWDLATGSDDVVLAVVDSGVDLEHPDLEGRLLPGHDFVNDDDSPDDDFGHGTQIATIAAAATDNRTGMAGVAWRGKVLPVKVLDQEGRGNDADIAAGIVWAADHGADVINLSFGAPHPSFTLTQAVNHARTRDVVIVSAAGNGQTANPDFPAALDGVVSVSGTDRNGYFAWFSNFGPTVDVAAPGMEVLAGSPGAYQRMEGTSYAAPIVAGVAMLVRARFPGENADQVIERLRMGARDAGPLGIDDYYGFGLIDALGALGGPSPAPREEATDRLLHEPDNTPDRASPIGSGTSAVIAPEGDVDWFSYDVPSARWLTFSVVPPTSGGARRMDAVVELYGPGLRLMQRADRAPSGGREEITAGVGSGRYYLRVSNFGATAGPAPYQVSVTPAPDPEAGRFRFPSIEMRSLPGTAAAVAIGDLSGDGANDILVSTIGDSTVASELRLYRQSAGGFETPRSIPIGGSGEGMGLDLGDLDGDGDLDAALANTDGIKLHYQSGGGLGPAKFVSAPGFWQLRPTQVEIGDIDGDGRQDLVTATLVDGVHVLFNRGTAFEDAGVNSTFAPEIEVADLNGDGREDIVTWECIPDRCEDIAVYTAKAGGGFSRTTMVLNGGTQGFSLGVGDVTGDGRPDVVGANGNIVHIFPQQADGTFAGGGGWGLGDHHTHVPMTVEVGDVEGDGPDDIAVLYGGLGLVYVTEQDRPMWSGDLEGNHTFGPKALAFGDIDSDGLADLAVASQEHGLVTLRRSSQADPGPQSPGGDRVWVRDTTPADGSTGATPDVRPALRFGRPLRPTSVTAATVTLVDGATGSSLPAGVVYDPAANSVILEPRVPLTRGRPYLVRLAGVQDADGHMLPVSSCCLRFLVGEPSDRSNPRIHPAGGSARSGYWMLGADGRVFAFGDAANAGEATAFLPSPGPRAVDLEPVPSGAGYWILDTVGHVFGFGAPYLGGVDPAALGVGESVTALSATPSGAGYWIFTSQGRVFAFGDAAHHDDLAGIPLNGPVLDSIATPTGKGYYMVASDGGIFTFGDARFAGSLGDIKLNAPVQSLVPDGDGAGYWLVASDGGVFTFGTPFRGSLGDVRLNKPITGMVPYGNGYLMVGEDGGIFNFSDRPFSGSLGASPPTHPVVSVAALP